MISDTTSAGGVEPSGVATYETASHSCSIRASMIEAATTTSSRLGIEFYLLLYQIISVFFVAENVRLNKKSQQTASGGKT